MLQRLKCLLGFHVLCECGNCSKCQFCNDMYDKSDRMLCPKCENNSFFAMKTGVLKCVLCDFEFWWSEHFQEK